MNVDKFKIPFNNLTDSDINNIINWYKNHTDVSVIKKFNITYSSWYKIISKYNIKKHDRKTSNLYKCLEKDKYDTFSVDYILNILNFYKNNSFSDTLNHFNIKHYYLEYLLNINNIQKRSRIEERKLTNKNKYGVEYAIQNQKVKEKLINTKNEKTENQKELIINKSKKTKLLKYGSENYNNRAKANKTCLEKYGVDNPYKSDLIKTKIKEIKKEKYGDENYTNKTKFHATCLMKYGKENFLGSDIGKQKIKEYYNNKLGVDYPFLSKDWQQKNLQKRKVKYLNNYNNRCKAYETMLKRYNVNYYCITDDCRNSIGGKGFKSKPNELFSEFLDKNGIKYEREFKLEKYSYDFKINNILVEINPSATHNSTWNPFNTQKTGIDKYYHYNKSNIANKYNFRCIHIWDWIDWFKILEMLNFNKIKIFARKCIIKEISKKEINNFLNINHLQGKCNGNIYNYGLFYNNELVQVISFGKSRFNKKYDYELLRLCTKMNYLIIGGAEKLFTYFITKIEKNSNIISYCDFSIFNGDIYKKLGFKLINTTLIKHWYNIKTKEHYTDNYIQKLGFDKIFKTNYGKGTSNSYLMLTHGFIEIWDSGQRLFEYTV